VISTQLAGAEDRKDVGFTHHTVVEKKQQKRRRVGNIVESEV
jgi:hypothetical protein